jgi:hypothetical protein
MKGGGVSQGFQDILELLSSSQSKSFIFWRALSSGIWRHRRFRGNAASIFRVEEEII